MPVERLLSGGAFRPEQVRAICHAFDDAWEALVASGSPVTKPNLAPPAREALAKCIIDEVLRGALDVDALKDHALAYLRDNPPVGTPDRG
jgi:hypothetical protein